MQAFYWYFLNIYSVYIYIYIHIYFHTAQGFRSLSPMTNDNKGEGCRSVWKGATNVCRVNRIAISQLQDQKR